jgi:hypothetical protein
MLARKHEGAGIQQRPEEVAKKSAPKDLSCPIATHTTIKSPPRKCGKQPVENDSQRNCSAQK